MGSERPLTDTLIVGAGPAGLALGACLREADVPFIIVERGDSPGASWRNHYDRLHLHTVKKHSSLPYLAFPDTVPKYPSRQDVIDYLDAYARRFGLNPMCGEDVVSVRQCDEGWETTTTKTKYVSTRVAIAAGYNRRPYIPDWPGKNAFRGTIAHSASYRNGEPYRGKRVLIVGIGNSGGEIAMDLHEHGAASIAICVRTPVNIIPRDILGTPAQVTGIMLSYLPEFLSDLIGATVARLAVGDLSQYGIHRPNISPAAQVNRYGRIPLIDIGTVDLIKRGAVRVVPAIDRFTETGAVLIDRTALELDSVILATGYRPGLEDFLEDSASVVDAHEYPIPSAGESDKPGLYFLGYANPSTGLLRQIAIDAKRVARDIAAKCTVAASP